jgi:hypothetical protein
MRNIQKSEFNSPESTHFKVIQLMRNFISINNYYIGIFTDSSFIIMIIARGYQSMQ